MFRYLVRKLAYLQINPVKLYSLAALVLLVASSTGIISNLAQDIFDSLNNNVRFAEAYGDTESCSYEIVNFENSPLSDTYTTLNNPVEPGVTSLNNGQQVSLPFDFRVGGKVYNSLYAGIKTNISGSSIQNNGIAVSFDSDIDSNPDDFFLHDIGNPVTDYARVEGYRGQGVTDQYIGPTGQLQTYPYDSAGIRLTAPMRHETLGTAPNRQFVMEWNTAPVDLIPNAVADSFIIGRQVTQTLDVLWNDYNHNRNPVTVSIVTAPDHGSANVVNNRIEYTPDGTYPSNGIDTIEYILTDDITGYTSTLTTVELAVEYIDLFDETLGAVGNSQNIDVLYNDYLYAGAQHVNLSIVSVTPGFSATVEVDNTITFTRTNPGSQFANIRYGVSDSSGEYREANLIIDYTIPQGLVYEDEVDFYNFYSNGSGNNYFRQIYMNTNSTKVIDLDSWLVFEKDPSKLNLSFNGQTTYQSDKFQAEINGTQLTVTSLDNFGFQDSFFDDYIPLTVEVESEFNSNYTAVYEAQLEIEAINDLEATYQVVVHEKNGLLEFRQAGQYTSVAYYNDTRNDAYDPKSITMVGMQARIIDPLDMVNNVNFIYETDAESDLSDNYLIYNSSENPDFNVGSKVQIRPKNCIPNGVGDNYTVNGGVVTNLDVASNDQDIEFARDSVNNSLKADSIASQPSNGTVQILVDGTINYTPDNGFIGNDFFEYNLTDSWFDDLDEYSMDSPQISYSIPVYVTVENSVNNAPLAVDDKATTLFETPVQILVLNNDSDPDMDALQVCTGQLSAPSNGQASIVNNGIQIEYTPNNGFSGQDTFTYRACDQEDQSNPATVTVTVSALLNNPPVSNNDFIELDEDTSAEFNVLSNDSDPDNDTLEICNGSLSQPANGILEVTSNGLRYTPNANYFGPDSFSYRSCDQEDQSNPATVNITVNPVNDTPIANPDNATTNEDESVDIDVLANDTDIENTPLSICSDSLSQPANGAVSIVGNQVRYIPDANFYGQDTFTYRACDESGQSESTLVLIDVLPVNDLPITLPDVATTEEDVPVTIDVLDNDNDVDGNTLEICANTNPANGSVILQNDVFIYSPNTGFNGNDSFDYSACDQEGQSAMTPVYITINPNDPPVANPDNATTDEDNAIEIDVLANDTDPEGDELNICAGVAPSNGGVQIVNNRFIYTPNSNFFGQDTIVYFVCDDRDQSSQTTVTITINPINDLPVANPDIVTTNEDESVVIDVLANDTDIENAALTICSNSLSTPANGGVSIVTNMVRYIPNPNFFGQDTFTYRACDEAGQSNQTTVTITVNPVNDLPVANPDDVTTPEDTPILIDVLQNDTDGDNDILTICTQSLTQPIYGQVSIVENKILYTPNFNFNGQDVSQYEACDPQGRSLPVMVVVNVTPVNDTPNAGDDTIVTNEDNSVVLNVLNNDIDPDGDVLNICADSISSPSNGSLVQNVNQLTYTPNNNYFGNDSFTYRACDGAAQSNLATVNITVNPINDLPVARPDVATTSFRTSTQINILDNDTDIDGQLDQESIEILDSPSYGQIRIENGRVIYTPTITNLTSNIQDFFSYTVADQQGGVSNITSVTINLVYDNQPPTISDQSVTTYPGTSVDFLPATINDPDGDNPVTIEIGEVAQGLSCSVTDNNIIRCLPDSDLEVGVYDLQVFPIDAKSLRGQPAVYTVEVLELITTTTLTRNVAATQLQVGQTVKTQVSIANPNPVSLRDVRTVVAVDSQKLRLITNTIQSGTLADFSSVNFLSIGVHAQSSNYQILTDSSFAINIPILQPGQSVNYTFDTEVLQSGEAQITAQTQSLGQRAQGSQAALQSPAQPASVLQNVVRTGSRLEIIIGAIVIFGLFLLAWLFYRSSQDKLIHE